MKKSSKVLAYGSLSAILLIGSCLFLHQDEFLNESKTIMDKNFEEKPPLESIQDILNHKKPVPPKVRQVTDEEEETPIPRKIETSKVEERVKAKATLEYIISDGEIRISGTMPLMEENDTLKQSMMRRCQTTSCTRTIIFSPEQEDPAWKTLAQEVITLFEDENLSSATLSVDESSKVMIGGEFPSIRSKDRLSKLIKTYRFYDINNSSTLKVLKSRSKNVIVDENISTLKNIKKSDDLGSVQTKIVEILKSKKINFYRNRAKLTEKSIKTLDEIVALLKDIKNIKIIVKGYTDVSGKRSINRWISKERAKSVKNYLGSHEINPTIIEAKGFGEDGLLYPDRPYSKDNRRVEIEIKRR